MIVDGTNPRDGCEDRHGAEVARVLRATPAAAVCCRSEVSTFRQHLRHIAVEAPSLSWLPGRPHCHSIDEIRLLLSC